VTWHIVNDDVECLHVERNPTIACSGSHLYKFYRLLSDALVNHRSVYPLETICVSILIRIV
jgi:hypothetical protein